MNIATPAVGNPVAGNPSWGVQSAPNGTALVIVIYPPGQNSHGVPARQSIRLPIVDLPELAARISDFLAWKPAPAPKRMP